MFVTGDIGRYLAPHFASEYHEVKYQHPFNGSTIVHWEETKKRPMPLGDLDDESVWWDQLEWAPGPREMAYGDL